MGNKQEIINKITKLAVQLGWDIAYKRSHGKVRMDGFILGTPNMIADSIANPKKWVYYELKKDLQDVTETEGHDKSAVD